MQVSFAFCSGMHEFCAAAETERSFSFGLRLDLGACFVSPLSCSFPFPHKASEKFRQRWAKFGDDIVPSRREQATSPAFASYY